jgi:hypothetical protein
MTSDDVRARCLSMMHQLLTQGLQRPLYFAAVTPDGAMTAGSSETIAGGVQPLVNPSAMCVPFPLYRLPIHCLFVDPQGKVAHGRIEGSGAVSCRVLP